MSNLKEQIARFGMISKGVIYTLIGVLTAMAAFGYGGNKTGTKGSLDYIASQSFGSILLIVLGLGLVAYVFWRFYQAFGNHDKFEDNTKGYIKRIAYFISGLIYGTLSYYCLQLVFESDKESSRSYDFNEIFALCIGIGLGVKAIYDLYRAYSKKFKEDINELQMGSEEKKLLLHTGRLGHTSRGIVLGIMAYLTFTSYKEIGKQTEAFGYIEQNFGSIILGIIALGMACYGGYMFIKAKYPDTVVS